MKTKRRRVPAYMTLEVSLLFPIIIVLLVCITYIMFYSYNQTIAYQNAAIIALYGESFAYTEEGNSELTARMYSTLNKINRDQYFAIRDLKQTVSIEKNKIVITQYGSVKMPIFSENIVSKIGFSEKIILNIQDKVFFIRQIRKVKRDES